MAIERFSGSLIAVRGHQVARAAPVDRGPTATAAAVNAFIDIRGGGYALSVMQRWATQGGMTINRATRDKSGRKCSKYSTKRATKLFDTQLPGGE